VDAKHVENISYSIPHKMSIAKLVVLSKYRMNSFVISSSLEEIQFVETLRGIKITSSQGYLIWIEQKRLPIICFVKILYEFSSFNERPDRFS